MSTQMTIWEMEYIKPNRPMNVIVACEESQTVCKAFRERGHNAFSCDIQECSGGHPEWHICEDVLPLLNGNCFFKTVDGCEHTINGKWDLIIVAKGKTNARILNLIQLMLLEKMQKNINRKKIEKSYSKYL